MPLARTGGGPNPDPYRYRLGWSPTARVAASQQVRAAMESATGLLGVAEAVAEAVLDIMVAKAVTVTLLDEQDFRDLVKVGELLADENRFPKDERYPTSLYPLATEQLLARKGYVSSDTSLDVVAEHSKVALRSNMGSFMGVPVIASGEVMGEIFVTRAQGVPVFLQEDMNVAQDLATPFGTRLPSLMADM